MPVIGSAFFSMGSVFLFNSVLKCLPDAYPGYAASVLAGNIFIRFAVGPGFSVVRAQCTTIWAWIWLHIVLCCCDHSYAVPILLRKSNHTRSALQLCRRSLGLARHYARSTVNVLERTSDVEMTTRSQEGYSESTLHC